MKYETAKLFVTVWASVTLILVIYSMVTLWLEDRKNKKDDA